MPIKVACHCGQRFSARDDLAGKTVRCPKCGGSLTIPAPQPPAVPEPVMPVLLDDTPPPTPSMPWDDADMQPPPIKRTAVPAVPRRRGAAPAQADLGPPASSAQRGWILTDAGLLIAFVSLIIGGAGFAVLTLVVLAAMFSTEMFGRIMMGDVGSGFLGIVLPWCVAGFAGSYVSLLTGWLLCWAVPEKKKLRPLIMATVGCVGASLGLLVLMQLITTLAKPAAPERMSFQGSFDEMHKFNLEMEKKMKQREESMKTINTIGKVFTWLSVLASIGSAAVFAIFLGMLGHHLGNLLLRLLGLGFAGFEGFFALWMTLLMFVISPDSATAMKLILLFTMLLLLATYGGLIYMTFSARRCLHVKG